MFDERIRGHQAIRQRLLDRVQNGRLTGSLLFTGPEAIGKRRVALELAQRELCFRQSACGHCSGCKPFQEDPLPVELPNLLRIAPEGKAGLIKIGVIREDDLVEGGVVRWAHQASLPGCHRWILVEDAHRLNGASANMLLKTIEEPPPGTHFLLISHRPEGMLPTIRSRCERIPFGLLQDEEVWATAQNCGWEDIHRDRWVALAAGTLRYLEPSAFERGVDQVEAWLALAAGASFQDAAGALLPEKNASAAQSEQMACCLELLLRLLADISRLRAGKPLRLEPWRTRIETVANSTLQLKRPQELVFEALRNLIRNPYAESLVREVGLTLRAV